MTTTTTAGATVVQAASLLVAHLTDHALPEPASLTVTTGNGRSEVTTQLRCPTVSAVAADLLALADTLSVVTVEAWRTPERDRVHLSIASTLTTPAGTVELHVFGGTNYDSARFADLQPDERRRASLGQLHSWAAHPSTTTTTPVLQPHRAPR